MPITEPVIIVGAGVVGLALAQGLKKNNIPFILLERDASATSRSQGWGLTIHWALPYLESLLPSHIVPALPATQVDPSINPSSTRFLFLDASNATVKFEVPKKGNDRRLRVNRDKFRRLMCTDVPIRYQSRVVDFTIDDNTGGVTVVTDDGETVSGSILVGADGAVSSVRRLLFTPKRSATNNTNDPPYSPSPIPPPANPTHELHNLPVKFLGVTVTLPNDVVTPLRSIDPLMLQAAHPDTGNFLWFSTLAASPPRHTTVQICVSWRIRARPFPSFPPNPDDTVASTPAGRLSQMKRRVLTFHPTFRDAVMAIPDGTDVCEIIVADWEPQMWDNHGGRVTLAGDAAHAMTMYRGEAANHGFLDANKLVGALVGVHKDGMDLRRAIDGYEDEMRERTRTAVLQSRQAALDAHDWSRLDKESPVVARRAEDYGRTEGVAQA